MKKKIFLYIAFMPLTCLGMHREQKSLTDQERVTNQLLNNSFPIFGSNNVLLLGEYTATYADTFATDRVPNGSLIVQNTNAPLSACQTDKLTKKNVLYALSTSVEASPEFKDCFDRILSFNTLHFLSEQDQEKAVKSYYNALVPSGTLYLSFAKISNILQKIHETLQKYKDKPEWQETLEHIPSEQPHCISGENDLQQLATQCGFPTMDITRNNQQVTKSNDTFELEVITIVKNYYDLSRLEEQEKKELENAIVENAASIFKKHLQDNQEQLLINRETFVFTAHKLADK